MWSGKFCCVYNMNWTELSFNLSKKSFYQNIYCSFQPREHTPVNMPLVASTGQARYWHVPACLCGLSLPVCLFSETLQLFFLCDNFIVYISGLQLKIPCDVAGSKLYLLMTLVATTTRGSAGMILMCEMLIGLLLRIIFPCNAQLF